MCSKIPLDLLRFFILCFWQYKKPNTLNPILSEMSYK